MYGSKRFAKGALLRFLNRRRILAVFGALVIAGLAVAGILAAYMHSAAFGERIHHYIVSEIEQRTGATVTLKSFSWDFWQRRIRLDDLTLRGLEAAGHPPLAHFARIDVGLKLRTLLERRIDL